MGGDRGSRAGSRTAKATESALGPGAGAQEPSGVLGVERADGRPGNSESRLGPAICGVPGSDAPPITGEPGKRSGRSSGSRSGSQYSEAGKAGHMGKDPRFIDAREGAEGP